MRPRPRRAKRFLHVVASVVLFVVSIGTIKAGETSYWIWGQRSALTPGERAELARQGTRVLYRQVATTDGATTPDALLTTGAILAADSESFTVIPVIRVEGRAVPKAEHFLRMRERFSMLRGDALQLDFDCPDRLLAEYAGLLGALREHWPKLSITALAHWPSVKDFPLVARNVEEVCPMFYDLQRDPTGVSPANPPPPLLEVEQFARLVEAWKECPSRWRAGLPIFSRVTVFDQTGLSRGQIFGWQWDEIVFNPRLRSEAPSGRGVQLLRVSKPTTVARRALEPGELVAVRQTDPSAFAKCRALAEAAGADGVVLFRMPDPQDASTWSCRSAAFPEEGPKLRARLSQDSLVLENMGGGDLAPRLHGEKHDRDRGHVLEIDAPAPMFREAEAGQFFRVNAHVSPEKDPERAPVILATRLTFWFSKLDAGATLRSGLFQLAPKADTKRVRWRVGNSQWQPLIPQ